MIFVRVSGASLLVSFLCPPRVQTRACPLAVSSSTYSKTQCINFFLVIYIPNSYSYRNISFSLSTLAISSLPQYTGAIPITLLGKCWAQTGPKPYQKHYTVSAIPPCCGPSTNVDETKSVQGIYYPSTTSAVLTDSMRKLGSGLTTCPHPKSNALNAIPDIVRNATTHISKKITWPSRV